MENNQTDHGRRHNHHSHNSEALPNTEQNQHRQHQHRDHTGHMEHHKTMFRNRFWICLILTVPALVWEPMLQGWFNYRAPVFPGSQYIPSLFGSIVFFYGGLIFLKGALRELYNRQPGMMILIGLAITVAFIYSAAVTFGFKGNALWWELATLVTIMLLGHWIEMRSISQAQGALKELAKLLPDTALKLDENEQLTEINVTELQKDDIILIRPGASIPVDGIVVKGKSSLNESMITGESTPIKKAEGDEVIAGTVNSDGSLRVKVREFGDETTLAGIMRLVEQAQQSRSRAQSLADRAAFVLTLVAISAAVITFSVWLLFGASLDFTITRVVTVLVIACPHALGLAIPLMIAISTTLGARNGLLVRDRRGLEEARKLSIVVFDKTGTLTLGEHRVVKTVASSTIDKREALKLAAAVEHDSEHPIARALLNSAKEKNLELPEIKEFKAIAGHGVQASVSGRELSVGGPALLRKFSIELSPEFKEVTQSFSDNGQTTVYLIEKSQILAVFAIADAIREESYQAVRDLKKQGIEVAMLTGDSQAVAKSIARELGIDILFAEVLPDDKAEKIKELQSKDKSVVMVGDGVNDAPALVTADIGIAIGAGTDVAVEAGDIILIRSDPRDVSRIILLSKATYRKMLQNLWWAAGYNIVAIPLAAGILAWAGLLLVPAVGAILMSISTVIVALNSQLLKRIKF